MEGGEVGDGCVGGVLFFWFGVVIPLSWSWLQYINSASLSQR